MASKIEQPTVPSSGRHAPRQLCKESPTAGCSPASNSEPQQQLSIKLQPPDISPCVSSLDDRPSVAFSLLGSDAHRRHDGASISFSAHRGTPSSTRSAPTPQLGRSNTTQGIFGQLPSSYSPSTEGKKTDSTPMFAEPVVGSLLMPDGVTIRRPPKLGISSGDPVGTHILRRRTACPLPESASPSGPFASHLNLSLHRRSVNTSWQRNFRASAWASGSRRRVPISRHLNSTADSLPRIVAFSPSLNRALFQDTCLIAPLRSASSSALSASPQVATSVSEPPPYVPDPLSLELQQSPDSCLKPVDGVTSSPGSSCQVLPLQELDSPLPRLTRPLVSTHDAAVADGEAASAQSVPGEHADSLCREAQKTGVTRAPLGGVSPFSHSDGSTLPGPSSPEMGTAGKIGEALPEHEGILAQDDISRETKRYEDELAVNPKNEEAVYQLGVLKFRAGRVDDAIKLVSEFLHAHAPKRPKMEGRPQDSVQHDTGSLDRECGGADARADKQLNAPEHGQEDGAVRAREGQEAGGHSREERASRESGENNEDNKELSTRDERKENEKETERAEAGTTKSKEETIPDTLSSNRNKQSGREQDGRVDTEGESTEEQLDWRIGKAAPIQKLYNVILDRRSQINRRAKDILEDWGPPVYLQLEKLLGHLWFEAENFPDAVRHYWRCIDICPEDAQLFTNLGLAYYEMEAMKEATAAFEQAIKLNDRHV
ncbi:conserved hypothetical protein [Neospora caninum Liverpool]|uniref:Tetratricopeptide repeat-containing protein n=1 Tax=Neospora caninum (strain Liverpool) TaxID=572307 RepID=F0VRG5_NEOCL|nr:conserved hypothetical protein [Neospora caninum Liverpool]CBZ56313.1 conserved hypothetical protein [Neospora caninum Liverpool]|eukprot:XP_003886338.1 conserved hypothetical protein [Neospora caninum Liverpool]